jgi:hypothetical protein
MRYPSEGYDFSFENSQVVPYVGIIRKEVWNTREGKKVPLEVWKILRHTDFIRSEI